MPFFSRNVTDNDEIRLIVASALRRSRRRTEGQFTDRPEVLIQDALLLCDDAAHAVAWAREQARAIRTARLVLRILALQYTHGLDPHVFHPAQNREQQLHESYRQFEQRRRMALYRLGGSPAYA